MQSLVSTQMVEYPSFCFHDDLVFQERTSICVNAAYSSLLISEHLPVHKLYPVHEHSQHPERRLLYRPAMAFILARRRGLMVS